MKKYLLLRNNKKSGPHTYDEMVCLSLKPQDLVWVEGKSTAWRYPAEMPEFKVIPGLDPSCAHVTASPGTGKKPVRLSSPVSLPIPAGFAEISDLIPTLALFVGDEHFGYSTTSDLTKKVFISLPSMTEDRPVIISVASSPGGSGRKDPGRSSTKKVKPALQPIIPEFRRSARHGDAVEQVYQLSTRPIIVHFLADEDHTELN